MLTQIGYSTFLYGDFRRSCAITDFLKLLAKVPEVLKEDLSVTIAAQILTLPIIAYHFGQVSLIGIMG